MSTTKRTPAAVAIAAPDGVPAKRAAAAAAAAEALAATLAASNTARDTVIVKHYGDGVTPAAVRLAKRAADELSGAAKSRGGARADVLAVLDTLAGVDTLDARAFTLAAAARLAVNAADVKSRRDRKRTLADQRNDASLPIEARHNALEVLAGMDDEDNKVKRAAVMQRMTAVFESAAKLGIPADTIADTLATAYGVNVSVSYPAAVPADAATVA